MSNNNAGAQAGPPQNPTPTPTSPTLPPTTTVARQTPAPTGQLTPPPAATKAPTTYDANGNPINYNHAAATSHPQPQPQDDMAKALLMITQLLGRNRPEDDLSTHFRQQAEEKDDPWKKKRAALRRRTATWDAEFQANSGKAWDELRHHFAKAGFNALVTEEVAQELAYILEASPLQQYRRARALLQMSTADRLSLQVCVNKV